MKLYDNTNINYEDIIKIGHHVYEIFKIINYKILKK